MAAAAAAAAAILRFRNLRHAKVPSMINATNSPEHTIAIVVLSLGARLVRGPLVGETVLLWLVDDSESEKDEEDVKFALRPVSVGAAFVICMSAVGTARRGVQLEIPRKSIMDVVAFC